MSAKEQAAAEVEALERRMAEAKLLANVGTRPAEKRRCIEGEELVEQ